MPLDSVTLADEWRRQRHGGAAKPHPLPPPSARVAPLVARPPDATDTVDEAKARGDTPDAAYERTRAMEKAAYDLAMNAVQTGSDQAQRLISIHAQTVKNLVDARDQVLKQQETERTLVSGAWVKKIMIDHDGAAATLARSMPKQLAGRLCPHDPEFAERELERWVQDVFLKTMHETNPWKEVN